MACQVTERLAEVIHLYVSGNFFHNPRCCTKDIRHNGPDAFINTDYHGGYLGIKGILQVCMPDKCFCQSFFQDEFSGTQEQIAANV